MKLVFWILHWICKLIWRIPGLGRSPGVGNGNPVQYSCLENPMDWAAWFATVHRIWHPTPVLLPGKSHGWRNLVGCSPWGHWESDTTEWLYLDFSLSCIGEGNGSPLQCSCLENPRDGGAWWAAIYGVAQSQTRLKRHSSSSSSSSSSSRRLYLRPGERYYQSGGSGIWNSRGAVA